MPILRLFSYESASDRILKIGLYLLSHDQKTSILHQIAPPTPTYGSRGGRVFTAICLSVFVRYIKTDAAGITKRDIRSMHNESWKSIYFGVKTLTVKVTSHNNSAGVGLCTLVIAGFFYCITMPIRTSACFRGAGLYIYRLAMMNWPNSSPV